MFIETELATIYGRNLFLFAYVSTMLEDLQLFENEEAYSEEREPRDVDTVYTIPAETFGRALADCEAFMRVANRDGAFDAAAAVRDLESLGSDFHMTRVGHGTGYWDRSELEEGGVGAALTEAAHMFRNEGGYFGDDGRVYL